MLRKNTHNSTLALKRGSTFVSRQSWVTEANAECCTGARASTLWARPVRLHRYPLICRGAEVHPFWTPEIHIMCHIHGDVPAHVVKIHTKAVRSVWFVGICASSACPLVFCNKGCRRYEKAKCIYNQPPNRAEHLVSEKTVFQTFMKHPRVILHTGKLLSGSLLWVQILYLRAKLRSN